MGDLYLFLFWRLVISYLLTYLLSLLDDRRFFTNHIYGAMQRIECSIDRMHVPSC
jgi:hypothetical protein